LRGEESDLCAGKDYEYSTVNIFRHQFFALFIHNGYIYRLRFIQNPHFSMKKRFLTLLIILLLIVIYFVIGRFTQSVPDIPFSYFDKTRVNESLPDAENGLLHLEKLIGSTEHRLTDEEMEKYPLMIENPNQRRSSFPNLVEL
jgi:hypothetical protein